MPDYLRTPEEIAAVVRSEFKNPNQWPEWWRSDDRGLLAAVALWAATEALKRPERAPVQTDRNYSKPKGTISWEEHVEAWTFYADRWPGQSAQMIAERGGFSYGEVFGFLGHPPKSWEPQ